jgi:RimJ/RimL family protein N-acetyltransferase
MAPPVFVLHNGFLTDGVISLRAPNDDDAVLYRSAAEDPEINRRLGALPDAPQVVLEAVLGSWKSGKVATLVIVPDSDQAAGVVMIEPGPTSRANVGYWLLKDYRGSGYATRALILASRWSFDSLSVQRLQLFCEVDNIPSQRVAEGAGYRRDGTLRSYFQTGQERSDAFVYSLLPSDSFGTNC